MLKMIFASLLMVSTVFAAEKKSTERVPASSYATIANCILGDAWNGIDLQKNDKYYRIEISNMVDSDDGGLSYIRYYIPVSDSRAVGLANLSAGAYTFESLGKKGTGWETRESHGGSISFGGSTTKSLLFAISRNNQARVAFNGEVVSCELKKR